MVIRHTESTITTGDFPDLLGGVIKPPPWMADALCSQFEPSFFFPEKGGSTAEAKAICAKCPVTAECLEYALAAEAGSHGERTSYGQHGIYGGLAPIERRALLRQRRREAS